MAGIYGDGKGTQMKETIHYIADIRYVSAITSNRYSSKRQVVEEHIRYIEKSANYEFGNKKLVLENSEKYNKRINSRVAGKTVFALPNDIQKEDYEKWCRYIQSVLVENFKVNPEYMYIAIHESHKLQGELGTKNLHAHVVFNPITSQGKAIQTKISDLKQLHNSWRQILVREGYVVRKETESIGKIGWKLRKDEELLFAYKEYVNSKKEQQQAVRLAKESRNRMQFLEVAGQPQQIAEIEIVEPGHPEKPQPQPEAVSKVLYPNRSEGIYQEAPKTYQSITEHTTPEQKSNVTYQNIPEQNTPQQNKEKRKREIQSLLAEKPLGEAIKTVRMLRKSEVDREIQRYLDNILDNLNRKAAEILKQRQTEIKHPEQVRIQKQPVQIAEPEQKPETEPVPTRDKQILRSSQKQPEKVAEQSKETVIRVNTLSERGSQNRKPLPETVQRKPELAEHMQPQQEQQEEIKTFRNRARKFIIIKEAILEAMYEDPEKGIQLLEMLEKFKTKSKIIEELISEKPYLEVLVELKQRKKQEVKEEQKKSKFEKPFWEPPAPE